MGRLFDTTKKQQNHNNYHALTEKKLIFKIKEKLMVNNTTVIREDKGNTIIIPQLPHTTTKSKTSLTITNLHEPKKTIHRNIKELCGTPSTIAHTPCEQTTSGNT